VVEAVGHACWVGSLSAMSPQGPTPAALQLICFEHQTLLSSNPLCFPMAASRGPWFWGSLHLAAPGSQFSQAPRALKPTAAMPDVPTLLLRAVLSFFICSSHLNTQILQPVPLPDRDGSGCGLVLALKVKLEAPQPSPRPWKWF